MTGYHITDGAYGCDASVMARKDCTAGRTSAEHPLARGTLLPQVTSGSAITIIGCGRPAMSLLNAGV